ncbi:ceramide synthase 6 isoform X5 [Eurosta solidaginis]|uniref:ceramide synthase 6 isoform X5 n=1 Tax=Eurosta solidaginis TaxID=178769 RepID=UPI00353079A4
MYILKAIGKNFWSTEIWLPPNTTWEDIAPGSRPDVTHADYRDLIWPIPMAFFVLLLRYTLERFWIMPIGKSLGIKSTRSKKAADVPVLERVYEKCNRLNNKMSVSNDIWWYYMISMSFYWSLTVTQFIDVKRKDFWQMFVHHMVTLLLMSLSWVCNLHRVGSLVLVVHDCADIFLEAAKLTKYAKYQKLCDFIFAIFTVVWIATRLGFYPRIIYSSSVEAPKILPMFPAYYIFNSLLILLLLLHIVWTYLILKIVVDSLQKGLMSGDIRSSDSEEVSDSSESAANLLNGNLGEPAK